MTESIIIMGGSTGAGKTTHGKLLAMHRGLKYVSSGDIARSAMDVNTESAFARGELSPHSDAIDRAIHGELKSFPGVVLDGYPRTSDQLQKITTWADRLGKKLMLVWLMPSRAVLMTRWANRKRDEFDTEDISRRRDDLYNTATIPVFVSMMTDMDMHAAIKIMISEESEGIHTVQQKILDWYDGLEANNE